jgi:WD40 repeat protein
LAKDSGLFSAGSWNNNIDFQFIVAEQDNLIFVDVRSGKYVYLTMGKRIFVDQDVSGCRESMRVKGAHQLQVRDVEFNPNQPYYLVTGGDDCKTKFWDSRKLEKPIRAVGHHQHWYAIRESLIKATIVLVWQDTTAGRLQRFLFVFSCHLGLICKPNCS